MSRDEFVSHRPDRVTPRAMRTYAMALGLEQIKEIHGGIVVYHLPASPAKQVVIPLDSSFEDYGDLVLVAVDRFAAFDKRSPSDVLDHLLLPPADLFKFRDTGPDAKDGTLSLNQAVDMINGIKKALLSGSHSVLKPQSYHPRMGRTEAETFVDSCRFGQTKRESFAISVACPLDTIPAEGELLNGETPFARRVTLALMQAMTDIAKAGESGSIDELLELNEHPYLSSNFCEAIASLRPVGERPSLEISAEWSRAAKASVPSDIPSRVKLDVESFKIAETLAPKLKDKSKPKEDFFICYVNELKGVPGPSNHPAGEVILSLFDEDATLRTRAILNETEYTIAVNAHITNQPVISKGRLQRLPRLSKLDSIVRFALLDSMSKDHDTHKS